MDFRELGQMSTEQEIGHWWIRTRYLYLEEALSRAAHGHEHPLSVLEMGSGSGQNLHFIRRESAWGHRVAELVAVEPQWPEAAERPPYLQPHDRVLRAPEKDWADRFDLLITMDVLEHTSDDRATLAHWMSWIKPGGALFVTVPAFQDLWSAHDEKLGHFRRYTRDTLDTLAREVGLEPQGTRYIFSHAFPAVYAVRKLLGGLTRGTKAGETDLQPVPGRLNQWLISLGKLEASWGGNPWFGTSVTGTFIKSKSRGGVP